MTARWRIRAEGCEPRYRNTEGGALAWGRRMANLYRANTAVQERTDSGWVTRHQLQPSKDAA